MRRRPQIRFFHEYFRYIVGICDKAGIFLSRSTLNKLLRTSTPTFQIGEVSAPQSGGFPDESAQAFDERNGLILLDGSFLRFFEKVQVSRRNGVKILAYSYHYQRTGENFFFRFDFEEEPTVEPIRKPQYHLHTSAKSEIHYPSAPVELAFIVDFIKVNFFS